MGRNEGLSCGKRGGKERQDGTWGRSGGVVTVKCHRHVEEEETWPAAVLSGTARK